MIHVSDILVDDRDRQVVLLTHHRHADSRASHFVSRDPCERLPGLNSKPQMPRSRSPPIDENTLEPLLSHGIQLIQNSNLLSQIRLKRQPVARAASNHCIKSLSASLKLQRNLMIHALAPRALPRRTSNCLAGEVLRSFSKQLFCSLQINHTFTGLQLPR